MSDWQPGDLALCVSTRPFKEGVRGVWGLKTGGIYRVSGLAIDPSDSGLILFLENVARCTLTGGFCQSRFRKVTPGADIEGIEVERRVPVKGEPAHA